MNESIMLIVVVAIGVGTILGWFGHLIKVGRGVYNPDGSTVSRNFYEHMGLSIVCPPIGVWFFISSIFKKPHVETVAKPNPSTKESIDSKPNLPVRSESEIDNPLSDAVEEAVEAVFDSMVSDPTPEILEKEAIVVETDKAIKRHNDTIGIAPMVGSPIPTSMFDTHGDSGINPDSTSRSSSSYAEFEKISVTNDSSGNLSSGSSGRSSDESSNTSSYVSSGGSYSGSSGGSPD